jgi:predicted DNA-binding transcriptional regulator AlpA
MVRYKALPPMLPPRLLNREASAAYVGVCPVTFDAMVRIGLMPKPKVVFGRRVAWDVRELDSAIDRLPSVGEDSGIDTTWDDIDAPPTAPVR